MKLIHNYIFIHFVIQHGCTKYFMQDRTFLRDYKVSFNRMNILSFNKTAHFREQSLRINGNSELFESWTNPQFWEYSLVRSHYQRAFARFHSLWRSNSIKACSSWVHTIFYLQYGYLYTPTSKNVARENGEWQLSNGNCTTKWNCGFHSWYAKKMSSSRAPKSDTAVRTVDWLRLNTTVHQKFGNIAFHCPFSNA